MAKLTEEEKRVHNAQMIDWACDELRRRWWEAINRGHPWNIIIEANGDGPTFRGYTVDEKTSYKTEKLLKDNGDPNDHRNREAS